MDRKQVSGVLILLAILAGCGGPRRIAVGSKNFTEQVVLGEITAQLLEKRLQQPVQRRLDLGGTLLAHAALVSGQIDVYPEYTGTALTAVLKQPAANDPAKVLQTVRAEYARQFGLHWLDPLGFNDSFAMAVRGEDARSKGLKTIGDAARCCAWRLGVGYEFLTRPDGLPSLTAAYPGLRQEGSPKSMDLGLLYRALQEKQVDLVAGNTTDGMLAALDVTVLADDAHAFPPYEASLVVRAGALTEYPGLEAALHALAGRISEDTMRKLNYEVDGKHRPVAEVAAEFLKGAGL